MCVPIGTAMIISPSCHLVVSHDTSIYNIKGIVNVLGKYNMYLLLGQIQ